MRVLITRPIDDANATADILRARGHEPVIAPLLEIRYRDGVNVPLSDVKTILATSANGIRALSRNSLRRDIVVMAVGEQTAEAARSAGFETVQSADGDARDLADLVIRSLPKSGALLHAAGTQTKGDLAATLERAGFTVRTCALYEVVAASALPPGLKDQAIDAALFYSPRSASVFAMLAQSAHLPCDKVRACCISAATAKPLSALDFRDIRIAPRPSQQALLALLDAPD
jgi:uroporphyrinogen-III synthase